MIVMNTPKIHDYLYTTCIVKSAAGHPSVKKNFCSYDSHVKLFYGASDRGAWSLGSQYILNERSSSPPNSEATNIRFLKQRTSIPIPTIIQNWEEENGRYFMLTKRIQGETLAAAWPTMTTADKEHVAKQNRRIPLRASAAPIIKDA
jgi:aminoglycoside phosphotransferase